MSIFETIYAVTDEPDAQSSRLLGTAFAIGRSVFATAGHVAEDVAASTRPALRRFQSDGTMQPIPIVKSEAWGNVDFGLLQADHSPDTILSWLEPRIVEPTDVYTVGFAFGQDLQRRRLSMRHFKGYVVSTQRYASWAELEPGRTQVSDYTFWTYELSFACPKGQSGAPLLAKLPDGSSVVGVVIGNSTSSMGLLSRLEVEDNGTHVTRYESHEFLHLGQAIAVQSLLDGESLLLGALREGGRETRAPLRSHLGAEMVRRVTVSGPTRTQNAR